jgi:hypothetical protein
MTKKNIPPEIAAPGHPSAAVTRPEHPQQIAPTDASAAEKIRKFLENVVPWPGPNDTGCINMYVSGYGRSIGWPFNEPAAFMNRAHWVERTSSLSDVRICMSQQSEWTKNHLGKPRAVTKIANATWLRSIWIRFTVKTKGRKHYRSLQDAWAAFVAFRRKVGLPFPSAVVSFGECLDVYWISDTSLSQDQWKLYAYGLGFLLRREGVKCDADLTFYNSQLLRVPGTMASYYNPPRPVQLLHLGRRYDFSSTLTILRDTATETFAAARIAFQVRARTNSADQT